MDVPSNQFLMRFTPMTRAPVENSASLARFLAGKKRHRDPPIAWDRQDQHRRPRSLQHRINPSHGWATRLLLHELKRSWAGICGSVPTRTMIPHVCKPLCPHLNPNVSRFTLCALLYIVAGTESRLLRS